MNLDDLEAIARYDAGDMHKWMMSLPQQCEDAWAATRALELPAEFRQARHVVIAGMGGSAIGGALLQALVAPECPVPVTVVRDYTLPAFVRGPEALVIASSYSGNTEETLAAFDEARARGARVLAQTAGGTLAERANAYGVQVVPMPTAAPAPQPRALVGYSFVTLAGIMQRLGFVSDKTADVQEAAELTRSSAAQFKAETPAVRNPAKRLAGQLVGRIPAVYGADLLAPLAQRWKGQFNENAKTWSEFEVLPEQNHNAIAGILCPPDQMTRVAVIILASTLYSPRIRLRCDVTRELLLQQGILVDEVRARGASRLAQMLSILQYGDFASFYLAMAYAVDPTPIPPIALLKQELARA